MNPLRAIGNIWSGLSRLAADRDPTSNFWYGPVGGGNKSGVPVSDSSAMTYSAVWAATRLLSGTIGLLPLDLYRRTPGGGREIVADDPRETLVHDRPNDEMGAMMFRSSCSAQQVNAGNCFAEIERTRGGQPLKLWPLHYSWVKPVRVGDSMAYTVRRPDMQPVTILPQNMLHIPSMMSDDGCWGKGVIANARESIGFGLATEQYGASWFGDGAQPKVIVSTPKQMMPDARDNFRSEWKSTYGSPDGSKVAILTAGMTATSLNISAADQQFLETRQHNIEEIARWYGVPPHMIQQLLRATFSNIEHQQIEFVTFCLMPWLKLWEQELWAKLLTPAEQKTMFFEFNVNALLRGDAKTRSELYRGGITTGWLSPNEVRAFENLNPYDEGDDFYMQGAMLPVDMLGAQQEAAMAATGAPPAEDSADDRSMPETPAEDGPDASQETVQRDACVKAARLMLAGAVSRMVRREAHEARNAAKNPKRFGIWLDSFYGDETVEKYRESISAPCEALTVLGITTDAATLAAAQVAQSREELLELSGQCTAGELAPRIDVHVAQWELTRPDQVAESAISRSDNERN